MLTVCSGPIFVDPVFLERPRSSWLVLYFWIRRGCGAPGSADYSYRSQLEYFLSIYLELRGGGGGGCPARGIVREEGHVSDTACDVPMIRAVGGQGGGTKGESPRLDDLASHVQKSTQMH